MFVLFADDSETEQRPTHGIVVVPSENLPSLLYDYDRILFQYVFHHVSDDFGVENRLPVFFLDIGQCTDQHQPILIPQHLPLLTHPHRQSLHILRDLLPQSPPNKLINRLVMWQERIRELPPHIIPRVKPNIGINGRVELGELLSEEGLALGGEVLGEFLAADLFAEGGGLVAQGGEAALGGVGGGLGVDSGD